MEIITGILAALPAINKINEGGGLNKEKYPALNTDETDPEKFWNSLNRGKFFMSGGKRYYDLKHQVGSVAVDNGLMSVNFLWDGRNTKYKDLSKRQQKIIRLVLSYKDEPYSQLNLRQLSGGLFRV